jgi:hypothetical protein
MAAAASSTLLQGSNFTNARRVPRTSDQQRIPNCVARRSSPSSLCFRTGSGRTAAVVRAAAAAAAGDGDASVVSLPAALLFDCDGVLVDTEKDGHRISFNETFAEVKHPAPLILIFYDTFAPKCILVLVLNLDRLLSTMRLRVA